VKSNFEALDRHHGTYRRSSSYDNLTRHYTFEAFKPFLANSDATALELGCSDGLMTQMISARVSRLDVVEGSSKFIQEAQSRNIPNASFTHSLFEDFDSELKYDYIFATFVLTHVDDLKRFFDKLRSLLSPNGLLFASVPNSRVLSRQLAQHMGLVHELLALTENDKNHGHCRAYDRVHLNRDLQQNGFSTVSQGGILLKPLADFQMDILVDTGILRKEQMDGLFSLGLEYPDLCGSLFSVCKIKS
jgi:2-polyprenyl-3-methyl-5-hydroxy-6-metoxy-1,4-benzoquinol methylase